jgi:hypothetical protein
MSQERKLSPASKRPYEMFGLTEQEALHWRVSKERFEELIDDDNTLIHKVDESSNNYGDFMFVTTSRSGEQGRICMTFYGLGYHDHRERWVTEEWYWYQTRADPEVTQIRLEKEEVQELLEQRAEELKPYQGKDTQTNRGKLFEFLAELTDEDGALAELEDLEPLADWLMESADDEPEIVPPTGENLLDEESREKLPALYSNEEEGLDAVAQVKFFTPDAGWTWYASEFDGDDILFGLVDGLELELGYFSLEELKSVKGPMGLPIERDMHYKPKTLKELMEWHKKQREE